jgi:hypothetical protein
MAGDDVAFFNDLNCFRHRTVTQVLHSLPRR